MSRAHAPTSPDELRDLIRAYADRVYGAGGWTFASLVVDFPPDSPGGGEVVTARPVTTQAEASC